MEAVGYAFQGQYHSLQSAHRGCFFFNDSYFPVTADTIRQGNEHHRVIRCLKIEDNRYKALKGATVLLTEPHNTVLGYYEGDRLIPLQENEQFWIIYRDRQYPLRWDDLNRNEVCTNLENL